MATSLSSLALSAESLIGTHQSAHGIPALQKTLEELEAESALLASRGGKREGNAFAAVQPMAVDGGARLAGAELLAAKNFDARALHRQIAELEARAAYAAGGAVDGEDLGHALSERCDVVVVSAIEGAIQDALEDSERFALDEQVGAWEREKAKILEDLGLRALEWEPVPPPSAAGGRLAEPMDVATSTKFSTASKGGAHRARLDGAAAAHGEVVTRLNRYALLGDRERKRVDDEGGMRVASDFGSLATRPSALAVAWRVVHSTTREDRGGDIVQPSTGEALTNGNEATRRRGAAFLAGEDLADAWLGLGARRALEAQFREYVDGAGLFNFPSM